MEQTNTKRTENGTDWREKLEEIRIRQSTPMTQDEVNDVFMDIENLLKEKDELRKKELKEAIDDAIAVFSTNGGEMIALTPLGEQKRDKIFKKFNLN